LSYQG